MTHREQLRRWQRRASSEFYAIWLLAAITYGAGDIITTMLVVYGHPALGEANPVVGWLIMRFGIGGFLLAKIGIFLGGIALSWEGVKTGSVLLYYLPVVGMVVFGVVATVINLNLLT
ncbi:MAG: hypothetical protein SVG88_11630 [Halobacteriales archaeon]|nr:hypothetical protein [Halobacteriales archaeon]